MAIFYTRSSGGGFGKFAGFGRLKLLADRAFDRSGSAAQRVSDPEIFVCDEEAVNPVKPVKSVKSVSPVQGYVSDDQAERAILSVLQLGVDYYRGIGGGHSRKSMEDTVKFVMSLCKEARLSRVQVRNFDAKMDELQVSEGLQEMLPLLWLATNSPDYQRRMGSLTL